MLYYLHSHLEYSDSLVAPPSQHNTADAWGVDAAGDAGAAGGWSFGAVGALAQWLHDTYPVW